MRVNRVLRRVSSAVAVVTVCLGINPAPAIAGVRPNLEYVFASTFNGTNYSGGHSVDLTETSGPDSCSASRGTVPNNGTPNGEFVPGQQPVPSFRSVSSSIHNCHKIQIVVVSSTHPLSPIYTLPAPNVTGWGNNPNIVGYYFYY